MSNSRTKHKPAHPAAAFCRQLCIAVILPGCSLWSAATAAQEISPRAYWPAPQGTNVLVTGYQYTAGDVVTDPSLPITGVDSSIHIGSLTYQRTLGLFGRTTNFQMSLPYTSSTTEGFLEGEFLTREISALADSQFRFSVNLLGAPAMDVAGFQALIAEPGPIIGVSILVQAPTGGYETDKVLNAGTNRWGIKPALGMILPFRPGWLFEFEIGAWLIGDNDEFVGMTREQEPIYSAEVHLVKNVRSGFWASLDANYYTGGESTIGGVERNDLQRNSRFGATLFFPFKRKHGFRVSYSTGLVTESGGDYEKFGLHYLYAWR
jgi:hypothetical protein